MTSLGIVGAAGCLGNGDDNEGTGDFRVGGLSPETPTIGEGEPLTVSATILNSGEASGTQTVDFRIEDEVLASQEMTLDASERRDVTFEEQDTSELEAGEYPFGVYSDDDNATGTLTIEGGPDFTEDAAQLVTIEDVADGILYLRPGEVEVTGVVESPYTFELTAVEITLSAPGDWNVQSETVTFESLSSLGLQDVSWDLEIPEGTSGDFELQFAVSYQAQGQEANVDFTQDVSIVEPISAPYGINHGGLSDEPTASIEVAGVPFEAHSDEREPNPAVTPNGTWSPSTHNEDAIEVEGTEYQQLYQTMMYGPTIGYEIEIEPGTYDVTIHTHEIHWEQDEGRIFSISVQGESVVEDLDLHAEVGYRTAYHVTTEVTVDEGERLIIETRAAEDFPSLSALEIRDAGAGSITDSDAGS